MHFPTMVHHAAKGRAKSVQFDKTSLVLDAPTADSVRNSAAPGPVPTIRTSSLPPVDKENVNSAIRHYRSMLDVEPAPKLPMTKPLSYDELYPKPPAEPKAAQRTSLKANLPEDSDSQRPHMSSPHHFRESLFQAVLSRTRC